MFQQRFRWQFGGRGIQILLNRNRKKRNLNQQNELEPQGSSSPIQLEHRIKAVADLYDTRVKAAGAAGISTDQLQAYITGQSKPGLIPVGRMAAGVGVSINWIWSGQPPMRLGYHPGIADDLGMWDAIRDHKVAVERERYLARLGAGAVSFGILEMSIRLLEQWLTDKCRAMPPAQKAEAIISIYRYAELKQVLESGELAEIIERIKA